MDETITYHQTKSVSKQYEEVRKLTEKICEPLETEDYVVQPIADVSPPKWHLGHTTWFFETFVLKEFNADYQEYHPDFAFVFNSYYEAAGDRVLRPNRGNLTRPTVKEVYAYRQYVDEHMLKLFEQVPSARHFQERVELGMNHEQQHQELLWTDIKYILGNNPLFPAYIDKNLWPNPKFPQSKWLSVDSGLYEIGYSEKRFCYDNELQRHKIYLNDFQISDQLVSNAEYLEFMDAGGYDNFTFWHSDGWEWVKQSQVCSPMYWHKVNNEWYNYTFNGLQVVNPEAPLCHISYYEAYAYAQWKGLRLPTEFEWEVASAHFNWGQRWEWTESAYLPYPGFSKADGAIGEYNGKFMVNQKVLRGCSVITSPGHSRTTYRNFFQPQLRWQYTGIRLAK